MDSNTSLELRRQGVHIILGVILITLYYQGMPFAIFAVLLGLMFIILVMANQRIEPFYRIVNHYDRKGQVIVGWGALTFLNGFFISTLLFEKDVALAALAIMVFGDGFSTLAGTILGKHRLYKKKTWEGSIAGLVTALVGALFFVSPTIALIGCVAGMITELSYKSHPLFDDNFYIPLVSGIAMFIAQILL